MQDFDQILTWPAEDYSRVPYRVFTDQDIFEAEQERIWKGPVWNYLALEAEVPKPGDFLVTYVGDTPVVVNRAEDGSIHAWVNRCAHRGTMVVREPRGNRTTHTCVYHHWCYDLKGNLIGVPFQKGSQRPGRHAEVFPQRGPRASDLQDRHPCGRDLRREPPRRRALGGLRR